MDSKIVVMIAAHKEYPMPTNALYQPVFVGADLKKDKPVPDGYVGDNSGENISALNPNFCELTGVYWGWKNLDSAYVGLAHYRRHFSLSHSKNHVLTMNEIELYTGKIKVFTPSKRRYYIETLYSHYAHTFDAKHLELTKKILEEKYPAFLKSFDTVVNRTWGYMFNMMIMQKALLDEYCAWLFDVLFELRSNVDESNMDAFQLRYPGRISEILFNVWLEHMLETGQLSKNEIKEIPVVSMEKVNWLKKGSAFLKAKFFGVKYDKSF